MCFCLVVFLHVCLGFCVVLGYVNLWVFAAVKRLAEKIVSKVTYNVLNQLDVILYILGL